MQALNDSYIVSYLEQDTPHINFPEIFEGCNT